MEFPTRTYSEIAARCCFSPHEYIPADWVGNILDGLKQTNYLQKVPASYVVSTTFFHDFLPEEVVARWVGVALEKYEIPFQIEENATLWESLCSSLKQDLIDVPMDHDSFVETEFKISLYSYLSLQTINGYEFVAKLGSYLPEAPDEEKYQSLIDLLIEVLLFYVQPTL